MRNKKTTLVIGILLTVLLMSCDPCIYHGHGNLGPDDPGTPGNESFAVNTIDTTGDILVLSSARWIDDSGQFVLSLDYGEISKDAVASVHIDGDEIKSPDNSVSYSVSKTDVGCDFTFAGMPTGEHVILISLQATGTQMGVGSISLRVEIPYQISFS